MDVSARLQAAIRGAMGDLPIHSTDPGSDEHHLAAAVEWLYRSQDVTGTGGSAATYNLVLGWEDPYPETTGYIVPTLFSYSAAMGVPEAAERAVRMADWLCTVQKEDGSFPGGTGKEGDPNVFNTGQIVFGLASAYRETGDERYRAATEDACDWLVDQQTEAGYWDEYDYNDEVHAYSSRVGWALLEGAEVLPGRSEAYREAARRNLEWASDLQTPNGWFERAGFEAGSTPYLHTIAYTVRGLLEGGLALEDGDLVETATRTADELLSLQQKNGILKGAYDASWSPSWYYCLTGNAQMAIVWLRLFEHTGDRDYRLAARRTIEFLKRRQVLDGPADLHGALAGSYPLVGSYLYLRFPNWAAKFFADALLLSRDQALVEAEGSEPSSTDGETCRVCLLCDGETVQSWVAEAITEMVERTNAEISLVVVNEETGTFGPENVKRGKKYPAYAFYWTANQLVDRYRSGKEYKKPVHINELPGCADVPRIRTYPVDVDGLWSELPDEVVSEVSSASDLVFRRGFGLISGEILRATKYGVLSYHHGDPRAYRGGPAGFWEYMNEEPTAGAMVQLLTEDLDAGKVLAYDEIDISDCESWADTRTALYENSTGLLASAVENVQNEAEDRLAVETPGEVHNPPSAGTLARYLWKRYTQALYGR